MRLPILILLTLIPLTASAQRRPAVVCSNGEVDPQNPPMVDGDVPEAVEHTHQGYEIRRSTLFSVPGLVLWEIVGRTRLEGFEDRYTHLVAVGADGHIMSQEALFLRLSRGQTPSVQARQLLATVVWRAGQRPLRTRDANPDRPYVRDPVAIGGVLRFWVQILPNAPYAREVEVNLSTGRSDVGALF